METKRMQRTWSVVVVLTLIVCVLAFAVHYKNWMCIQPDQISILSGIYYHTVKYSDLDKVEWVDKITPMQRINGFLAFEKTKGVYRGFKDTLTDKKVYVLIDDLSSQKILLVRKDSSQVYVNFQDSLETVELFNLIKEKLEIGSD